MATYAVWSVQILLSCLFFFCCLHCLVSVQQKGPAKCRAILFGVFASRFGIVFVFCIRERFPWLGGGGVRTSRCHGPLGCFPKRAWRPMGPATLQLYNPLSYKVGVLQTLQKRSKN